MNYCFDRVLPAGIEPASIPSEGTILSIERREVYNFKRSGRRESNPLYMTPSHAYYHYTTARFLK